MEKLEGTLDELISEYLCLDEINIQLLSSSILIPFDDPSPLR